MEPYELQVRSHLRISMDQIIEETYYKVFSPEQHHSSHPERAAALSDLLQLIHRAYELGVENGRLYQAAGE